MVCIKEIETGEITRIPNEEAVKKVRTEKFRYTDKGAWEAYCKEQEKKSSIQG